MLSCPQGHLTVARRFKAGWAGETTRVPQRRLTTYPTPISDCRRSRASSKTRQTLAQSCASMMFGLPLDVIDRRQLLLDSECECAISLLPGEPPGVNLVHPPRRRSFQQLYGLGQGQRGRQRQRDVHWSSVPPTIRALKPFFRTTPPMNDHSSSCESAAINLRRSLAEKMQYTRSET
jgi:hypothetical protein